MKYTIIIKNDTEKTLVIPADTAKQALRIASSRIEEGDVTNMDKIPSNRRTWVPYISTKKPPITQWKRDIEAEQCIQAFLED